MFLRPYFSFSKLTQDYLNSSHLFRQHTKHGSKVQKRKTNFFKQTSHNPNALARFSQTSNSTIGKQPSLMKNIFFGGFIKSWVVTSKKCNPVRKTHFPRLAGTADKYQSDSTHPYIIDISFRRGVFWCKHSGGFTAPILGHTHGCVLVGGGYEYEYSLYNPFTSSWSIPKWDCKFPLKYAAMSKDPEDRENRLMVAVTGPHCSDLVSCEFNYYKFEWSKQQPAIADHFSCNKQLMQFTNIMGHQGKFYALSLQGSLAVIEVIDSQIRITRVGSSRAVPSTPSKHFREFMIESEGEILLLFIISRQSIKFVDEVEIYRLEFGRLSWVKMSSLGDRTLFVVKNCCILIASSKVGCKGNCVYFTHQRNDDEWWVYDMEKRKILPGWDCGDSTTKSPKWDETIAEE